MPTGAAPPTEVEERDEDGEGGTGNGVGGDPKPTLVATPAASTASFAALSAALPGYAVASLRERNLEAPLPLQAKVLPQVLDGHDVVGIFARGGGRTLALVLAAVSHIEAKKSTQPGPGFTQALVLAASHERATKIHGEATQLLQRAGEGGDSKSVLRSACVNTETDGSAESAQPTEAWTAQLTVATPARLVQLVTSKALSLEHVTFVILDEADRLLVDDSLWNDMGTLSGQVRPERQLLFVAAAWSGTVQERARSLCKNGSTPTCMALAADGSAAPCVFSTPVDALPQAPKAEAAAPEAADSSAVSSAPPEAVPEGNKTPASETAQATEDAKTAPPSREAVTTKTDATENTPSTAAQKEEAKPAAGGTAQQQDQQQPKQQPQQKEQQPQQQKQQSQQQQQQQQPQQQPASKYKVQSGAVQQVIVIDHPGNSEKQAAEKDRVLAEHISKVMEKGDSNAIVVVAKREIADNLAAKTWEQGFKSAALHTGKSQEGRLWILDAFKKGHLRLLVATTTIGKGIDIPTISVEASHLIVVGMQNGVEDYKRYVEHAVKVRRCGCLHVLAFFEYCPEQHTAAKELSEFLKAHKAEVPEGLCKIAEQVATGNREIVVRRASPARLSPRSSPSGKVAWRDRHASESQRRPTGVKAQLSSVPRLRSAGRTRSRSSSRSSVARPGRSRAPSSRRSRERRRRHPTSSTTRKAVSSTRSAPRTSKRQRPSSKGRRSPAVSKRSLSRRASSVAGVKRKKATSQSQSQRRTVQATVAATTRGTPRPSATETAAAQWTTAWGVRPADGGTWTTQGKAANALSNFCTVRALPAQAKSAPTATGSSGTGSGATKALPLPGRVAAKGGTATATAKAMAKSRAPMEKVGIEEDASETGSVAALPNAVSPLLAVPLVGVGASEAGGTDHVFPPLPPLSQAAVSKAASKATTPVAAAPVGSTMTPVAGAALSGESAATTTKQPQAQQSQAEATAEGKPLAKTNAAALKELQDAWKEVEESKRQAAVERQRLETAAKQLAAERMQLAQERSDTHKDIAVTRAQVAQERAVFEVRATRLSEAEEKIRACQYEADKRQADIEERRATMDGQEANFTKRELALRDLAKKLEEQQRNQAATIEHARTKAALVSAEPAKRDESIKMLASAREQIAKERAEAAQQIHNERAAADLEINEKKNQIAADVMFATKECREAKENMAKERRRMAQEHANATAQIIAERSQLAKERLELDQKVAQLDESQRRLTALELDVQHRQMTHGLDQLMNLTQRLVHVGGNQAPVMHEMLRHLEATQRTQAALAANRAAFDLARQNEQTAAERSQIGQERQDLEKQRQEAGMQLNAERASNQQARDEVEEKASRVAKSEEMLRARESELGTLAADVDRRRVALDQRQAAQDQRDLSLEQRTAALEQREATLQTTAQHMEEERQSISSREAEFAQRQKALEQSESRLLALEQELAKRKSNLDVVRGASCSPDGGVAVAAEPLPSGGGSGRSSKRGTASGDGDASSRQAQLEASLAERETQLTQRAGEVEQAEERTRKMEEEVCRRRAEQEGELCRRRAELDTWKASLEEYKLAMEAREQELVRYRASLEEEAAKARQLHLSQKHHSKKKSGSRSRHASNSASSSSPSRDRRRRSDSSRSRGSRSTDSVSSKRRDRSETESGPEDEKMDDGSADPLHLFGGQPRAPDGTAPAVAAVTAAPAAAAPVVASVKTTGGSAARG